MFFKQYKLIIIKKKCLFETEYSNKYLFISIVLVHNVNLMRKTNFSRIKLTILCIIL